MFCKKTLVILSLFFPIIRVFGSDSSIKLKERIYVESNYHQGNVLPHHKYIGDYLTENVNGFQINIGLTTPGTKFWHQTFNYPLIGIGYYHSGLGNPKVFGNIDALFFYIDRSYLNLQNRFNLANKISIGLSSISKPFDKNFNPNNLAIGSHLNVYVNYSIEGTYLFHPIIQLKAGIGMSHASNGNINHPNKGLNIITAYGGLQYFMKNTTRISQIINPDTLKNEWVLTGFFGYKHIDMYDKLFSVYGISTGYLRKIHTTGHLGGVFTLYNDNSISKELIINNADTILSQFENYRYAVNIIYELRVGQLAFVIEPGMFIGRKNFLTRQNITNRIGLKYCHTSGITPSVSIRAWWPAAANFIEWGLGYRLAL